MDRHTLIEELLSTLHSFKRQLALKTGGTHDGAITPSQFAMLSFIDRNTSVSIKRLAEIVCMTSSGVTQVVDSLVKEGLVIRKQDEDDRRTIHVSLSKKGKEELTTLKKSHFEKMKELFTPLTDEELEQLLTLYKKVLRSQTS